MKERQTGKQTDQQTDTDRERDKSQKQRDGQRQTEGGREYTARKSGKPRNTRANGREGNPQIASTPALTRTCTRSAAGALCPPVLSRPSSSASRRPAAHATPRDLWRFLAGDAISTATKLRSVEANTGQRRARREEKANRSLAAGTWFGHLMKARGHLLTAPFSLRPGQSRPACRSFSAA